MWATEGSRRRPMGPGALRRALARDHHEPAWPFLPVLLALTACWFVMAMPWLVGPVSLKLGWAFDVLPYPQLRIGQRLTVPWDAKAHFQPQIQFLAQSLALGEWPWWTPHVFAGHPQIADPQSMIFSPPVLLLALVNGNPGLLAVDATVLLMQLAGAVALMLWMRDQEWHWAGALIGGIVFAFGASMAWRLQHTGQVFSLCYWPMAMLALDRAIRFQSYRWGLVAALPAAALVLGRDQVALLLVYLLIGFVLWRWFSSDQPRETIRSTLGPLLAGAALTLGLIAIPTALTALLAAESNRPAIDYIGAGRGSMHPALFLTLLIPQVFGAAYRMEDYWGPPSFAWSDTGLFIAQNMGQVYIGAAPILLLLLAASQGRFLAKEIRFFAAAFVLAVLYALGWFTPVFRILHEVLPGVKFYRRPADATFLIGGLAAVLTGYAVHRLFSNPWEKLSENAIAITASVVALAFVASLGIGLWLDRVWTLAVPLTVAALCIGAGAAVIAYVKPRIVLEPWPAALALAAVTCLDLGYNNGPSTSSALPPSTYEAMQPGTKNSTVQAIKTRLAESAADDKSGARRDRMEFMGVGFHWPNVSLSQGLENTLGYNPVRLKLYTQATGAEDHIGLPDQRKFSPLFPSYKSTLADMLGLRFIAAGQPLDWHDKALKTGDLKLVAKTDDAWLYENPRALPRVIMTTRADGADFDAILKSGQWPRDFDPTRTVLIPGTGKIAFVSPGATNAGSNVSARLISYRNTEIVVEALSPRGGWLVLNDPWHPWWYADVGGKEAPILRANVLFRAVELPAGRHTVRFTFKPLRGAYAQWSAARGEAPSSR